MMPSPILQDRTACVGALLRAERDGVKLSLADFTPPADYAAAMRVQGDVVSALHQPVVGWKLGFDPQGVPVAAPLLQGGMYVSPAMVTLRASDQILIEVEIAFILANDLPPRVESYARADILDAVGEVLIGMEILNSRLDGVAATHLAAWLADRLGNSGYVCGARQKADAGLDLASLACRLELGGKTVHNKIGGHPQGDPLAPLLAYANCQIDRLGGLRAGQVVTTGSLTTPLLCTANEHVLGSIDGIGSVEIKLSR